MGCKVVQQAYISKPEFLVDKLSDAAVPARLLERDIFERPEVYLSVIASGRLALTSKLPETGTPSEENPPTPEDEATARLSDFLTKRYDRDLDFDDQTTDALYSDDAHLQLISSFRNSEGFRQEKLRKDVSYSRIGFFVQRVLTWQEQQTAKTRGAKQGLRHVG